MPYVKIQDDQLLYDRTRNFSGIGDFIEINEIACPTKGSSVEFLAKDKALTTNNNYLNIMPVGINNLYANYNMVYEVEEEEAQKLANFIESKKGVEPVFFDSDPTIYKKINGYCSEYSINQIDVATFSIAAKFEVTESPGNFNWTGLNFITPDFETIFYQQENKQYKKNSIAFDQRLDAVYQDRINNIYYCTEDHDSSNDNSANLEESPYWTRDFFWQPDVGQQNSVKMDIQRFGDVDGYPLRRKVKDNTASFPITYTYSNINTFQLKSMLHFLESKAGYRRFKHRIAAVYNRPKVFVCRKWKHTWNSFDSHNLEVTFDEDPLGIIPDRVPQNEETLSTRLFDLEGDLFLQTNNDVPDNWAELEEDVYALKLGAGCNIIGDSAFKGAVNLQGKLVIPGSVHTIKDSAFDGCGGFNNDLILGGAINSIGFRAFADCNAMIGDLNLPPNVKYVGESAFENCTQMNGKFSLGAVLSGVGDRAFLNCTNLRDRLEIPATLKTISQAAFRGCQNLYGDLEIPSGVEYIESNAFWMCQSLGTDVVLPNTIKSIGSNAFYECDRVYNVYINAQQAPTIIGDPFPTANMQRLRKIHVPLGGEGYDTAYWQGKESEGKLSFDIVL